MKVGRDFDLPEWSARQIVLATLVALAVGGVFFLIYRYQRVAIIFFAALIISAALKPLAGRLVLRGVPRLVSLFLVYAALAMVLASLALAVVSLIGRQGASLAPLLPEGYADLRQGMLSHPNYVIWRLALELPEELPFSAEAAEPPAPRAGEPPAAEAPEEPAEPVTFGLVGVAIGTGFALVAVLLLSFYWTLDGPRIIQGLTMLAPAGERPELRQFIAEAEDKLGAFVVSQATLSLVVGAMALVAYLLIGLPYPVLLAVAAGIAEAIPLIGPLLGAVPAVVVALSVEPAAAIWVLLATLLIQQIENHFLVPRIMKRSVGVHPILTLLTLTGFGLLFGVPGALVAVPFAAVAQLYFDRYLLNSDGGQTAPAGRGQLSMLRLESLELAEDVHKQIRNKLEGGRPDERREALEDDLEGIAADLERLLAQAAEPPPTGGPE
ncbi:MAG: AI-2E family transporter [Candidatus Promineifilaceae bacterium]